MIEKIARRVIEKIALEESRMGQIASQQAVPSAGPGAGATSEAIGKAEPIAQAGPGIIRRGFNMATAPFRMAGRVATAPLRFAARHPLMTAGLGAAGLGALGIGAGHLANQGDLNNTVNNETWQTHLDYLKSRPNDAPMKRLLDMDPTEAMHEEAFGGMMQQKGLNTNRLKQRASSLFRTAKDSGGFLGTAAEFMQNKARSVFGDPAGMMSKIPVK